VPEEPGRPPAPRLFRALHAPLFAAPVRLVLALIGLLAALAVGIHPRPALLGFGAGTFGAAVVLLSDRRYALRALDEIVETPIEAEYEPPRRTAAAALLPSTVGTAVLAGASLAFSAALAVLLAGILAGMAIAGLVGAAQVAVWERRSRGRLFLDRRSGRRYTSAPDSAARHEGREAVRNQ
jgi:F0F1-type ATP synthase membrane subunit c/vacuolar-type H+-ATPase subunit K